MIDTPGRMLTLLLDADVLMASAASTRAHSAGQVLLTLSEITLVEAITSELVVEECRRNIPKTFARSEDVLEAFGTIVDRALTVVDRPTRDVVLAYRPYAAWSDAPHLASAAEHGCDSLVTYNISDYDASSLDVDVAEPGTVVRLVRTQLADL